MSGLKRVLVAALFGYLGLSNPALPATFDITGTVNIDGQTFAVGPSGSFDFLVDGSIPAPATFGYTLSVDLIGAPLTTATTTDITPFILASATASVNGNSAGASVGNCFNCGLFHPISGNGYSISDAQRDISVALAANFFTIGAVDNLPASDIITLAYNLNIGLPAGLSAEMVTPLPNSSWLFASVLGMIALTIWLRQRRSRGATLSAIVPRYAE